MKGRAGFPKTKTVAHTHSFVGENGGKKLITTAPFLYDKITYRRHTRQTPVRS